MMELDFIFVLFEFEFSNERICVDRDSEALLGDDGKL